jgi:hypothetical protein
MKTYVMFVLLVIASTLCQGQERYPLSPGWNHLFKPYEIYTESYSPNPPKIYSRGGRYLGELSKNRYAPDSVSNPHGNFGSRHSYNGVNNPNTMYGRYRDYGQVEIELPRW